MNIYLLQKHMAEENVSQEFRLKNIGVRRKYFIEEINQNELMSKKHKKVWTALNHIEHLFILTSVVTGCFNFTLCFCNWYSYRNYRFCSRIKNLCNNCRN